MEAQVELCRRIAKLKQRGMLGDWGYTVPMTKHSSTTDLGADQFSDAGDPPTSPIEMVSQTANCIYVVPVSLQNAEPHLVSVPDLTSDHDIVMAMGPQFEMESDLRHTIDMSPLYHTGTWSWMSAQLIMAGTGKLVVHEPVDDLESLFYILVGICIFLNSPLNLKCEKDLALCFDKYFNTFKPSILKMITIQSDITWMPFILHHISKKLFTHDLFITSIIETLSHLSPDTWVPVDQVGNNKDLANLEVKVKDELSTDGTKEASATEELDGHGAQLNSILHDHRGQSTGSILQQSACNMMCK
ncbi:hypothetical protein EDC04DRAFT_2605545 [Pisolithus marmoratus]|nr:hypothetical protein EDC04DRAFT_2605545 [Pisolithus marmoratus]